MQAALDPLARILALNTDLLLNTLDGVTDDEARHRLPGGGNSLGFIAAHLADSRHFLANLIGRPLENPLAPALAGARRIEDVRELPPLDAIRQAWTVVSEHLALALEELSAEDLVRPVTQRFPLGDGGVLGVIAFLVQHDSYHLGQAAFVRRQLGHPAMSYRRKPVAAG
ncbi:MAG: DinB family protein [Gemmatimonadales bacterium]